MMGVFAAAVARLTPTFVESFDPEKLASKFVRVEKEFGVKFTKSNSTFNIVGHWEAVRKAHKSLLKLKHNEKNDEQCTDIVDKKDETSNCKGVSMADDIIDVSISEEVSGDHVTKEPEKEQSSEKEPLFFRGKGNPKRGRQTAKESPYSGVPEPVFYLQYQDKTYTDACSLDIDSVLEDFEKSHHEKKVTKEDLKKILEKNKDQMGKPLEKGIPKGAILPAPKVSEDNCETFSVDDMLNPIPPSTQIPSDTSGYGFGMPANSKENAFSFITIGQTTFGSASTINLEMASQFNSSMITTYSVNAKMSTQSPGMVPCISGANIQGTVNGHLNISDFYNHTNVRNGRLGEGVFPDSRCNVTDTEQMQLSDSDTDSFSSMFEDYDPQAMLNQIPTSEMLRNIPEVSDKRSHQADTRLARDDETLQDNIEADSVDKESGFQNAEEIRTSFHPSQLTSDHVQSENNRIKMEIDNFKQEDTVTFEHYTEIPIHTSKLSSKDFSNVVILGSENNPAAINTSSDIVSMAMNAAHNTADTPSPGPAIPLASSNPVVSSTLMIQTNPSHFLKSMPTGEEFMKSLEVTTATEDQSFLYTPKDPSAGQTSFQNSADIPEDNIANSRSLDAMTTEVKTEIVADLREYSDTLEGKAVNSLSPRNKDAIRSNYKKDVVVENVFEGLVPETEGNHVDKGAVDIENDMDIPNISEEKVNSEELNQDVAGKVKKSKPAGKRVKKKATESSEKQKRERKHKSKAADGVIDRKSTRKDDGYPDGNEEPVKSHPEESDLECAKNGQSDDREDLKKFVKPSVASEGKEKQIYKCTECDYQGFRKKRLSEHMGRVHGLLPNGTLPENPMFSCDECEKTFVFEKDLTRHKKIVHHGQLFVCLVCNKNYKSKYVYERHTATHVEGYVQPKFKCQICEQEFTTKFSLSSHIKSKHLGVKKTYSCPTCGKTFSQIRSYRQHANVHAGIRPYTCEVCGKSFTYDKSLKEHRYMHDSVRRFQCTVCQKAFRQQTCLLIHMKTHKEKKDHICSVCGREFTQKQSLLRHERIHTGDKPYSCKVCFKSFGDYAVIRKHIMMAHKASKDGWKQFALTMENKRSSHYIDGGPGYVPRESYAKINQKSEENATIQNANFDQASDAVIQREQSANEVITPVNNLIPVQEIYQVPLYTSNLDFQVIANGSPSQVKPEDMALSVNRNGITSLEPDIFGNINVQQPNLTMKSYLSNINANTLTKIAESGEEKYVAQFQNPSDLVYNVAIEKPAPSAFAVKDELLSSSVPRVSVATSDMLSSGNLVTVASTNNSWVYPGYTSAFFSPSSFSPYQNSPDATQ